MVRIQVRDDGKSLTPVQLARVWTPYYKGEQPDGDSASGSGLGLAVVASLLWQVGGACRMRNREPGPGIIVQLDILVE